MAICKFFQQGNCKFGNSCRFEHPTNQSSNRFGALGNNNNAPRGLDKYNIKIDAITADLTTETPQWILSAYAPGKDAPDQLFGGSTREQSFEELRLHYMTGKAAGREQEALAEAQKLYQDAQQQMQTVLRNVNEAAQYVLDGENRHPNRHDICQQGTHGAPFGEFEVGKRSKNIYDGQQQSNNPFGSNNNNNNSAPANPFGQPSQPATSSPFGQPSQSTSSPFGQPSQPTTSAFGQPSALGAKPNPFGAPAFGQPAQPAAQASSPFGAPSTAPAASSPFGQPSTTSAFGQTSTLGAKPNPFGAPAFGQAAQPQQQQQQTTSAFGQASQLGAKPSPFGSSSTPSASPFGSNTNTNNPPAANPFGSNTSSASPFGAASNPPANNSNPFGSSTPSNPPAAANPFGSAQPATPSPFGQPSTAPAANPFGSAPAAAAANPFSSTPAANNNAGNPFSSTPAANPFSSGPPPAAPKPLQNPYAPDSAKQHPAFDSYANRNMDGTLAAFKGKAVSYKDGKPGIRQFDGTWAKIWFPDGPPAFYKDTEMPPDAYGDKDKEQWNKFMTTGTFEGGMPALPPPRECTQWDF